MGSIIARRFEFCLTASDGTNLCIINTPKDQAPSGKNASQQINYENSNFRVVGVPNIELPISATNKNTQKLSGSALKDRLNEYLEQLRKTQIPGTNDFYQGLEIENCDPEYEMCRIDQQSVPNLVQALLDLY